MHPHTVTAQRAAAVAEALTWLGTPYHHHGRVKKVGVDCGQLLIAVYAAARRGAPAVEPGHYPVEWHLHRGEELFLQWLQRAGARPVQAPALGDVAVYRFGRTYSHGAIVVAPDLRLHAYVGRGVILNRCTEEPLHGRAVTYWSPWP